MALILVMGLRKEFGARNLTEKADMSPENGEKRGRRWWWSVQGTPKRNRET